MQKIYKNVLPQDIGCYCMEGTKLTFPHLQFDCNCAYVVKQVWQGIFFV